MNGRPQHTKIRNFNLLNARQTHGSKSKRQLWLFDSSAKLSSVCQSASVYCFVESVKLTQMPK